MKYPLISIAIATLNSEDTLPKLLSSIRKQNYPRRSIEVLIIDGGSKDKTFEIARDFGATIIPNPKVDLVYAKHIGYKSAKGDFILFLDSDEVLENKNSLKLKCLAIKNNKGVRAVVSSGYKKPGSFHEINYYINEYGDPFSLFIYRSSRDVKWFLKELLAKYPVVDVNEHRAIFNFSEISNPPFIELISMGAMIDLKYARKTFPKVLTQPFMHIHMFYLLISRKSLIAVMKNDPIIHYSASNISNYLKKIKSRIKNNIYMTSMGKGGFSGREMYYSQWFKIKKFLFIPYSLSLVFPLFDSIYLYLTRKRRVYFLHPILCLYALLLILFYYLMKLTGQKPGQSSYGR